MNHLIEQFNKELTDLQRRILETYIAQNKIDPNLQIDDLIQMMQSKKDTLTKTLNGKRMRQQDGEVITARALNEIFAALYNDDFMLFGASTLVDRTLEKYKSLSQEKFRRLESAIKAQEARLKTLSFVNDHKEYLEAFLIDFQDNQELAHKSTIFNSNDQSLSSNVLSSEETDPNATVTITRVGNPEYKTLPNYQVNRMFDRSKLTAWYEIDSYKKKPNMVINPSQEAVLSIPSSFVEAKLNIGSTIIETNGTLFQSGEYISIGQVNSVTHETVKITNVDQVTGFLTTEALSNTHYVNEPIYKGRNLVQTYGAVAVVQIDFPYPQKVNFIRLTPFSSKPIRLHGMYVLSGDSREPWRRVENTEITKMDKNYGLTFQREISQSIRLLIEQPFSNTVAIEMSTQEEAKELAWSRIYEEEFDTHLPELNATLARYTESEINKANAENRRGFLSRKNVLDLLKGQNYVDDGTGITGQADQELSVLQNFTTNTTPDNTSTRVVTREVYELGLAELEIFNNVFKPESSFISSVITTKKDINSYSVYAEETLSEATSIQHSLVISTGEELPVPNRGSVGSSGRVESRGEMLVVDHDNKSAPLRFEPLKTQIKILRRFPLGDEITFTTNVVDQQVIIPAQHYHQKAVYETTYSVKFPEVDLLANLEGVPFTFDHRGTNDGEFLELPNSPYIELGIVNDPIRWSKPNRLAALWVLNLQSGFEWVDQPTLGKSFPSDALLFDNVYYGRKTDTPIIRTPVLESYIRSIITPYSGDTNIWVERFFEKYTGQTFEENLIYEPVQVNVNGLRAANLSNYDGSPDSSFVSSIQEDLQYRHFSDRVLFPEALDTSKQIVVSYRIKESTLQYKAKLLCNKNSNFYTSPILKSALIATSP